MQAKMHGDVSFSMKLWCLSERSMETHIYKMNRNDVKHFGEYWS